MNLFFKTKNFATELNQEIVFAGEQVEFDCDDFVLIQGRLKEPAFAQCVWNDVQMIHYNSITDARKKLREVSSRWRYIGTNCFRRGELICKELNIAKETDEFEFGSNVPNPNLPAFTLMNEKVVLYSNSISRPTLNGIIRFKENKIDPPSRAYLKLWESFTLLGDFPNASQTVYDLGSCPGSWTWAAAKLGSMVKSIDRSPLSENVSRLENVSFQTGDAFSVRPEKADWVLSDLICYPDKLFSLAQKWLQSGHCERFIFTIKFAGAPDLEVVRKFQNLPHSRVLHVSANKNELMWLRHPSLA